MYCGKLKAQKDFQASVEEKGVTRTANLDVKKG